MSQPKLKSIRLDDGSIIKIQVNEAINDPTPAPDFDAPVVEFEDEDDAIRSGKPDPNYSEDDDQERWSPPRISKGWRQSSQQDRMPAPPPSTPQVTPAQRVGALVESYTKQLVTDIRNTALSDVEIEKVTLEFGVSFDTELNAYVASTTLGCSVKVAIECNLTKPSAASTPPTP